jgi:Mrp family chromosome partitioning ATPase
VTPTASVSESFRILAANLMSVVGDGLLRTVLVVGAARGEGRTTVCAGLATALSDSGYGVLAVDLDTPHPDLHNQLGAHNDVGVTDVACLGVPVDEALQLLRTPVPGGRGQLRLLAGGSTGGAMPAIPILGIRTLLDQLAGTADVVVLDTPPLLTNAEALAADQAATGALVVIRSGRTRSTEVVEMRKALDRVGIRRLGLVLNQSGR